MEQMSLFGGFELETTKKSTAKDTTKKKAEPKKSTSAKAPAKPKEELKYELPLNVYYGYGVLSVEPNDPEKTEVTVSELRALIKNQVDELYPVYGKYLGAYATTDKVWNLHLEGGKKMVKGELKPDDIRGGVFYFDQEIDVSSLIPEEEEGEETIDVSALLEKIKQSDTSCQSPSIRVYSKDGIVAVEDDVKDEVRDSISGEVTAILPNGEKFEVDRTMEEDTNISKHDIYAAMVENRLDFFGHENNLHILKGKSDGEVYLCPFFSYPMQSEKKKETMYPTDGTTLSVCWHRYELSPEYFDGKTEVTEKELKKWLIKEKGMIELQTGKASTRYDEKNRFIIMNLYGESKGSDCGEETGGCREICNPIFCVKDMGDGDLSIRPTKGKIPAAILRKWYGFATEVFELQKTECQADIYFSEKEGQYFMYFPYQEVTQASVLAENDEMLESHIYSGCYKVCEIHSHGLYSAFWSSTDMKHEFRPMFYMVTGNIGDCDMLSRCRVIVNGKSVEIEPEDLFEDGMSYEAEHTPCNGEQVCFGVFSRENYRLFVGIKDGVRFLLVKNKLLSDSYAHAKGIERVYRCEDFDIFTSENEADARQVCWSALEDGCSTGEITHAQVWEWLA